MSPTESSRRPIERTIDTNPAKNPVITRVAKRLHESPRPTYLAATIPHSLIPAHRTKSVRFVTSSRARLGLGVRPCLVLTRGCWEPWTRKPHRLDRQRFQTD